MSIRRPSVRAALIFVWVALATATTAAQEAEFCWKDTITRGVGTVPQSCDSTRDRIGLLCYSKCPSNMKRFGFDCHSVCPAHMRDDGLFCRAAEYGRGAGYPWQGSDGLSSDGMIARCESDHGKGKCEMSGAIAYPKCAPGYEPVGCCICRPAVPNCPALGLNTGIDLSCAKKIIIGDPVPGVCGSGEERDAGLCYRACSSGYGGVGPVCWGQPPAGWVNCGMGAARDSTKCATVTLGQVASVGTLALNVATFGAATPLTAGMDAPATASRLAKLKQQFSQMQVAFENAKKTNPNVQAAVDAYEVAHKGKAGFVAMNTATDIVTEEDMVRLAAQIAAIMDPTGVADVVGSYTYAKCSKYFPTQPAPTGTVTWVKGPSLPANAVIGGGEGGVALPICRASYQNGVHPGKLFKGSCHIGYGGQEVRLSVFDVLTSSGPAPKWVWGPTIPKNAVPGGSENGQALPVCRASYGAGVHPGKALHGKCNIGWGGNEIRITTFEVLAMP